MTDYSPTHSHYEGPLTLIKGKDEALEISIEKMQHQLQSLGFDIKETLWLNPVNHIYSVNIQDKNCPLLFTNGKGNTKNACLASALGEFFERLNCNYFFADYYLGNKIAHDDFVHYPNEQWFLIQNSVLAMHEQLLNKELWALYDPEQQLSPQHLIDTNSGNQQRGICSLPFIRQSDQQETWFPVNIIGNLYVSNGMSAGNSMMEARTQALSEIIERSIKNKIIAEGISLPEVPDHIIEMYPKVISAINELEKEGFVIEVKDASLDGIYPIIAILMLEPHSGRCLVSFGAHPSFEVALDRTMTELLQGRRLNSLDGFQTPCFDAQAVADPVNLETHFIDSSGLISYDFFKKESDYEFIYWDFDGSNFAEHTLAEFNFLVSLFNEENKDIYIADYEHLGVYGCRIIIPGLSEIYPIEELSWQNNNEGVAQRARILSLNQLNPEQAQELLQELDESDYSDHSDVCGLIGIAPDPDSVWESLRVGELKGMLALHIGDYEQALDWSQWCLDIGEYTASRNKHYYALNALLEIQIDNNKHRKDYIEGLTLLYGDAYIKNAIALIDGDKHYDGLHDAGLELIGLHYHQNLLCAYEKLQTAKKQWAVN
ncbi:MAG: YcaO-like family protein [Gammaproteobacteria bacterium]|nr:YcaO-like family protein [Gammaproteobacteria bacterium]